MSLPLQSSVLKRHFSTTRILNVDEGSGSDHIPVMDEPAEIDSIETLITKRDTLGKHLAAVMNSASKIVETQGGSRPKKVELAKSLIEGDERYENVTINRQNCNEYLSKILKEHSQSTDKLIALDKQAEDILVAKGVDKDS